MKLRNQTLMPTQKYACDISNDCYKYIASDNSRSRMQWKDASSVPPLPQMLTSSVPQRGWVRARVCLARGQCYSRVLISSTIYISGIFPQEQDGGGGAPARAWAPWARAVQSARWGHCESQVTCDTWHVTCCRERAGLGWTDSGLRSQVIWASGRYRQRATSRGGSTLRTASVRAGRISPW